MVSLVDRLGVMVGTQSSLHQELLEMDVVAMDPVDLDCIIRRLYRSFMDL